MSADGQILNALVNGKRSAITRGMKTFALLVATVAALWASDFERQQPLFVIERSTNANVVHYDVNLAPNGEIDPNRPIQAYWIMAALDGHREELSSFERSRAYGFTVEPGVDSHSFRIELVSQKRRAIDVYRQGGLVRAETTIAGRRAYLTKIYVEAHKVLAVPTVRSIELFGVDVATGESLHETVAL
jgi:hypothetical protein